MIIILLRQYVTGIEDTGSSSLPTCWDTQGGSGACIISLQSFAHLLFYWDKLHNFPPLSYLRFPIISYSYWPYSIPSKTRTDSWFQGLHWGYSKGGSNEWILRVRCITLVKGVFHHLVILPFVQEWALVQPQINKDTCGVETKIRWYWSQLIWIGDARILKE